MTTSYFKLKTTGINPKKDIIYQCIIYTPSKGAKKHFFLEDFSKELPFLQELIKNFPHQIKSFRGSQFDLPFLQKKLDQFQLLTPLIQQEDLWLRQKNLSLFIEFPAQTVQGWHSYYTKKKALDFKEEKKLIESYYTHFDKRDKTKLFMALEEQVHWLPLLDQDLSKYENSLNLDDNFRFQTIQLLGSSLVYQGKTPYKNMEIYNPQGNLLIKDRSFKLEIPLSQGSLFSNPCYYTFEKNLKRISYGDLDLPDDLILVYAEKKFQKQDLLQLAKNRLRKLLQLP